MSQRFAFKMTLKAGNIGFGCDLRQVEAVLRHADRADPLRQIVHDDPVGALDPFAGVAVFYLLASDVQRIAFGLDLWITRARVIFQQRQAVRYHRC